MKTMEGRFDVDLNSIKNHLQCNYVDKSGRLITKRFVENIDKDDVIIHILKMFELSKFKYKEMVKTIIERNILGPYCIDCGENVCVFTNSGRCKNCAKLYTAKKSKEALLNKYGVDSYAKTPEYLNKVKKSNIEKYGCEWYMSTDSFKQKSKETNLDRRGAEHHTKTKQYKDKMKMYYMDEYGVSNPYNLSEKGPRPDYVKEKLSKSLTKYHRRNVTEQKISKLFEIYDEYRDGKKDIMFICNELSINRAMAFKLMIEFGLEINTHFIKSNGECEMYDFVKSIDDSVISGCRDVLGGLEIDVMSKKHSIGFEYSGIYWHNGDNKMYTKYLLSKKIGIELFQFFDVEWNNKKDIVKSMIKSKYGIYDNIIYGRKCNIIEMDAKNSNDFLENNHIQGGCVSKIKLGLSYEGSIVSVMTFSKSRFDKKVEWELIRYANKLGVSVIGGAEKLFSHFVKKYGPKNVVSYCDTRLFSGKVYKKLGFNLTKHTKPNYFYTKDFVSLENRIKYQKHKLKNMFENVDVGKTEKEIMEEFGYGILYDTGNDVFLWERNS